MNDVIAKLVDELNSIEKAAEDRELRMEEMDRRKEVMEGLWSKLH